MKQNKEVCMLKVGITGTIASGKTSVSILIRRRSFAVFNADNYAKMATHQGNVCFDPLIDVLGKDVIADDGDIDRKKMADIIFQNEEKRKQVNAITHPYVIHGLHQFFEHHAQDPMVFAEIPLLFEAHLEDEFDKIIVVTCDEETAIKRMMEDRNYSLTEAQHRYASQLSPSLQVEKADKVIENNGDLKALDSIVNQYIGQLRRELRNGNQS